MAAAAGDGGDVIRVLVVDDQAWIRDSLFALLSGTEDMAVVGECADGAEVVQAAAEVRPHVVLMDVHMPVVDGLTATRLLVAAQPAARVLVTGSLPARLAAQQAAAAGAAGTAPKGTPPQVLLQAIRVVAAGQTFWPGPTG